MSATKEMEPKTQRKLSMKITADRQSLLSALNIGSQAINPRSPKPVLTNVLLSADPNRCTLYATDMEVVVKAEFSASLESAGRVLAPAALLRAILRSSDEESVSLEVRDKTLHARLHSSQHKVPTEDANEFPSLPNPEWNAVVEIPAETLSACLRAVSPFTDVAASRYAMQAINVESAKNTLTFVATDGNALAAVEIGTDSDAVAHALLPERACKIISGVGDEGHAQFSISANWVSVKIGTVEVMSAQYEGRFPRWREIVQKRNSPDFSAHLIPSQLASLIHRTCVATPESTGPRAVMSFADGDLSLRCNVSGAESESILPCACEGKMESIFNWRYLLDACAAFAFFSDAPMRLSSEGSNEAILLSRDGISCVVMPIAPDR